MVDFKAVGISYHNAPLELRETVTLNESESRDFLFRLRETFDLNESLVISTCNRTEIYYSSNKDLSTEIVALLGTHKSIKTGLLEKHFRSFQSGETIHHLFEVSLGLDSKVLGDIQISNQIKRAYQASADLEMAGPFLHRLMHTIFYANKRVVQETRLQDGNASVASVSADLIKRFIENVADPKIALIGLGEIGQNVLENLGSIEASIYLLNRTKAKAQNLADAANVTVEDYQKKEEVIRDCDVIVSAVSGEKEVLNSDSFNDQTFQHKLVIDLSVPRSIPENIQQISGLTLYNVDDLSEKTEKVRKVRASSVPDAQEIIKESVAGFDEWREEIGVSPTIQKLKKTLDEIRKQELARHVGKVTDEEMALLEVVTKSMIQKVIKLPVLQLKAACKRGESENLVGVLNDLFNLEADEVNKG
ncbi:MAG: glutamyl-tRNA reductase [Cyclobacteriaceae bacterium]